MIRYFLYYGLSIEHLFILINSIGKGVFYVNKNNISVVYHNNQGLTYKNKLRTFFIEVLYIMTYNYGI